MEQVYVANQHLIDGFFVNIVQMFYSEAFEIRGLRKCDTTHTMCCHTYTIKIVQQRLTTDAFKEEEMQRNNFSRFILSPTKLHCLYSQRVNISPLLILQPFWIIYFTLIGGGKFGKEVCVS